MHCGTVLKSWLSPTCYVRLPSVTHLASVSPKHGYQEIRPLTVSSYMWGSYNPTAEKGFYIAWIAFECNATTSRSTCNMNDTGHFSLRWADTSTLAACGAGGGGAARGRGVTQQSHSHVKTEKWESRASMCSSEQLIISTCTLRKVNMATLLSFFPAMSPQSPEEALIIGNVTVIKFVRLENVAENSQVDKHV